jgi:hypothetical protein
MNVLLPVNCKTILAPSVVTVTLPPDLIVIAICYPVYVNVAGVSGLGVV